MPFDQVSLTGSQPQHIYYLKSTRRLAGDTPTAVAPCSFAQGARLHRGTNFGNRRQQIL